MANDDKKHKLLMAALEIANEKKYSSLRISDITERAGVAKGTFYTYFVDKEDCFRQAAVRIWELSCVKFAEIAFKFDIETMVNNLYDSIWGNRKLGRLIAYELLDEDKAFNKEITSKNKNMYKNIIRKLRPEDSEERLEIKAVAIMGLIDALIFEIFHCESVSDEIAKDRFVKAFIYTVNC